MHQRAQPSLFIVESVDFANEKAGDLEGEILSRILALSRKRTEYRYIRTRRELEAVMHQFTDSGMRYLHISCHGNSESLATTLDELPFHELGAILRPHLRGRRLFISACQAVNDDLAASVMRRNGCVSIVGPAADVRFDDAAVMWAAFYRLMFKENPKAMRPAAIKSALTLLQNTFETPMTYFGRRKAKPYWARIDLDGH